jgi:hypothetical protein
LGTLVEAAGVDASTGRTGTTVFLAGIKGFLADEGGLGRATCLAGGDLRARDAGAGAGFRALATFATGFLAGIDRSFDAGGIMKDAGLYRPPCESTGPRNL